MYTHSSATHLVNKLNMALNQHLFVCHIQRYYLCIISSVFLETVSTPDIDCSAKV
jgi:hypothetical protein